MLDNEYATRDLIPADLIRQLNEMSFERFLQEKGLTAEQADKSDWKDWLIWTDLGRK